RQLWSARMTRIVLVAPNDEGSLRAVRGRSPRIVHVLFKIQLLAFGSCSQLETLPDLEPGAISEWLKAKNLAPPAIFRGQFRHYCLIVFFFNAPGQPSR